MLTSMWCHMNLLSFRIISSKSLPSSPRPTCAAAQGTPMSAYVTPMAFRFPWQVTFEQSYRVVGDTDQMLKAE